MKFPEILDIVSEPVINSYSEKEVILYALSIGMGADTTREKELRFVYEKDLKTVPTFAINLCYGAGDIIERGEIDFRRQVHGEQRLQIHKPLPPTAAVRSQARCIGVVDKGREHGAVVNIQCTSENAVSGERYATTTVSLFCRGDGGFDGPTEGTLPRHEMPGRPPDKELALVTRPDQALLFRLNGDLNPLHCDPEIARVAGFEKPILHGLCTYGMACRAILQTWCDYDSDRISEFDARFSSPVYPGETIVTRMWKDGTTISFECDVAERSVTVIKNGRCLLTDE